MKNIIKKVIGLILLIPSIIMMAYSFTGIYVLLMQNWTMLAVIFGILLVWAITDFGLKLVFG